MSAVKLRISFVAHLAITFALFLATKPPASQAQTPYHWSNVAITAGGFVPGIEFSPAQQGLIYARTDIGGAYRWDSSAGRWIPLLDWVSSADSNLMGVESVAVDPVDANRVYLAVGTYTQSWAHNGAILRSTDQGRTWQRTDVPFKMGGNENGRSMGERLSVDPCRHNILYFGSRKNGLWLSTDFGATWSKVTNLPASDDSQGIGIAFVVFDPIDNPVGKPCQKIFVSVTNAAGPLFQTTDGGFSWTPVDGQPTDLIPHQAKVGQSGALYITYGNHPGPNDMSDGAVWKYSPDSNSWRNITPKQPNNSGQPGFGYAGLALECSSRQVLLVSTMDRWSGGDEIFRSADDGRTWRALKSQSVMDSSLSPWLNWGKTAPAFGWWIGALAIDPFNPAHVLYGTGATIWSSVDAAPQSASQVVHWTVGANGIEETAVISLASPPIGPSLWSGVGDIGGFTHWDVNRSPAEGMQTNPLFGATSSIDFAALKPTAIVRVGAAATGVSPGAVSTNSGESWKPFGALPSDGYKSGTVAVAADGSAIVWAPDKMPPCYSDDNGNSWTLCSGLPVDDRPVADRHSSNTFYAVDSATGKLLVSTNAGAVFNPTSSLPSSGPVRLYSSTFGSGDLWIVAGNNGLYQSTDGGSTFDRIAGVAQADVLGFGKSAAGVEYPTLFIAGAVQNKYGIYRSLDDGASWVRINDDQHQFAWIGQDITGDPRVFGRVYIATNGRGIILGNPAQ